MTRPPSVEEHDDLLSPHLFSLLKSARSLTRSEVDAQDLVQSTCLRALEALARLPAVPSTMGAWLLVMLRRIWFNTLRERRTRPTASLEALDDSPMRSDRTLVDTRATRPQIERAWRLLPAKAQEIATRCLVADEPYDLVTSLLGLAPGTVAKSLHRTRQTLKAVLDEDASPPPRSPVRRFPASLRPSRGSSP